MIPKLTPSNVPDITIEEIIRVLDSHHPLWFGEFCSAYDAHDLARGYCSKEQIKRRMINGIVSTVVRATIVAMQLKEAESGGTQSGS